MVCAIYQTVEIKEDKAVLSRHDLMYQVVGVSGSTGLV